MPVLCKPSLLLPEHVVSQAETLRMAERVYAGHPQLDAVLRMIRNTGVEKRHVIRPVEETLAEVGLGRRQKVYDAAVREMLPQVVMEALGHARLSSADIDAIVFVSCTGLAMPSPTAWMINELGFSWSTAQIPIAQLGCAAGAAAINRACDFARAHQGHVLVASCEFCSLLYQPGDHDLGSLLSNGLFGDAVGAAVVRADRTDEVSAAEAGGGERAEPAVSGLHVTAQGSHVLPGTESWISYEVTDQGLHFRLDKGVPSAMAGMVPPLQTFVKEQGHDLASLDRYAFHSGGPRVLEALRTQAGVTDTALRDSVETLADHGNIGSAALLDALIRTFDSDPPDGATVLAAGFGPGITMEMFFGTWHRAEEAFAGESERSA
ncbi:type III polyketide synthase [Streptomyces sp. 15-116A]|uniref:type III polyketide synthase n=1 Tax=Streptomyces sp. 15-116A TaxID=2259035 RepID=UPI0021B2D469|nr:type III polyketide synthase [Streptomyces sp. 15-116A]MCT7355001.1 type III polyketide synthase [Streptomyces sp. 15-116A]